MKITIKNFEKFNPRKDLKSMPWLRLENNFYDQEDFFDEDVDACWLYVFLLCQCAQKVSATVDMREKYLINKSKMGKKRFDAALLRLSYKSLILLETNESDRVRTDSCLTNERTERTNKRVRTDRASDFDLESIYALYPKKQGKAAGMKKLHSIIKSQETYDIVMQGVKNYADFVEREKTENKFIANFSTWVNQSRWEDNYSSDPSWEEKMLNFIGGENGTKLDKTC